MQLEGHLMHRYLCARIAFMSNERAWFSEAAGRKITVVEFAKHLSVSRNTATARLDDGFTSDEIIAVSRALHINPTQALQELGKLTINEVVAYFDGGGQLVETADAGYLSLELARRLNPASKLSEIDELAARRRRNTPTPPPSVRAISDDEAAAAIREAHQLRGAAHPATTELTEPETP